MSETESTAGIVEALLSRAREAEAKRKLLPCAEATDSQGDAPGIAACTAAGAAASCEWQAPNAPHRVALGVCPLARAQDAAQRKRARLVTAGVRVREFDRLMAAERPRTPDPLLETKPLRAMRALVAGVRLLGAPPPRAALVVLAGHLGTGKTMAACWALGELGGLYLTAYDFRPGLDIARARSSALLVIDQLGREPRGASDYGMAMIEETIDARYAQRTPTVLCCNLNEPDFAKRYQQVIGDRLTGDGSFILATGESLRKPG